MIMCFQYELFRHIARNIAIFVRYFVFQGRFK